MFKLSNQLFNFYFVNKIIQLIKLKIFMFTEIKLPSNHKLTSRTKCGFNTKKLLGENLFDNAIRNDVKKHACISCNVNSME